MTAEIPDRMLSAALELARAGIPVFPAHTPVDGNACSCGAASCTSVGKHPRTEHGFKSATTDEVTIRKWWALSPDANIAIPTGAASGVWALDVDQRDGGVDHFQELSASQPEVVTVEQLTGGGGRQLLFAYDEHSTTIKCWTDVVPGIDVRGEGGYIIGPPSLHRSGGRYAWVKGRGLGELAPIAAPEWIIELATKRQARQQSPPRLKREKSGVSRTPRILPPSEVRAIQSALACLDPNCDYDSWVQVGMMLESTGAGDQAFAIWDGWSARATRKCNQSDAPVYPGTAELRAKWSSFGSRLNELTIGSLFHRAWQAGWKGEVPGRRGIPAAEADLDLMKVRLTHLSFGRLVLSRHGEDFRYCHPWQKAVVWDGKRWIEDDKAMANQWATETQQWLKKLVGSAIAEVDEALDGEHDGGQSPRVGDQSETGTT